MLDAQREQLDSAAPRPRGRGRDRHRRRQLRRHRPGERRAGRGPGPRRPAARPARRRRAGPGPPRRGHLRHLRGVRRSPSATPASRSCRPPGSASSTPAEPVPRTVSMARPVHLVSRFFGSLRPGGPRAADREWAEAQLLPDELELWRRMSGPDRRHSAGVARRVRAGPRRRGHPPGARRRAAARRGQARRPPPHLRPGRGHPRRRRRRPRRGHDPALDASPPGFTRRVGPLPAAPRARRRPAERGRQRPADRGVGPRAPPPARRSGPSIRSWPRPCNDADDD